MTVYHDYDENGAVEITCMSADKPANFAEVFGWDAKRLRVAIGNDSQAAVFDLSIEGAKAFILELEQALVMSTYERETAGSLTE